MSKIEISKAIHNLVDAGIGSDLVVVSMSKIEISKAIHNILQMIYLWQCVVVSMSKIEISKAIHNKTTFIKELSLLLSVCQR